VPVSWTARSPVETAAASRAVDVWAWTVAVRWGEVARWVDALEELRARASAPAARATYRGSGGGNLASIRECESRGNYGAVSAGGTYRGAYQFDYQTWESVGGTGDPAAASPEEQDARAARLYAERGSEPWPVCG